MSYTAWPAALASATDNDYSSDDCPFFVFGTIPGLIPGVVEISVSTDVGSEHIVLGSMLVSHEALSPVVLWC